MPKSTNAFDATTATATGQTVAAAVATIQPYDNTDSVVVLNQSTTETVYVQVRTAPVAAANAIASSTPVPPESAITFPIGDVSTRNPYSVAAGEQTLYYSTGTAVGTASVAITYLNSQSR